MTRASRHLTLLALLVAAGILAGYVAIGSRQWSGATTPGFFADASGQISVLGLPYWPNTGAWYPIQITGVGGLPFKDAEQVYAAAATAPPGQALLYSANKLGAAGHDFKALPQVLSRSEHALLLLGLIVSGWLILAIAIASRWLAPDAPAGRAFAAACAALGTLAISSVAVAANGDLVTVQIFAQSLTPAALLHLALAFPNNRLRNNIPGLFALYLPFVGVAMVYQTIWPDPYGSTIMHALTSAAGCAAAAVLVVPWLLRLSTRTPIVQRRRAALVLSGLLVVATAAFFIALLFGFDRRCITLAIALTGWAPPFAFAAAVTAPDFFVLDQRLRGVATYGTAIPLIALVYLCILRALGPDWSLSAMLPFAAANLALVLAIPSISRILRNWVDRSFSPESYSPDRTLTRLNQGLSSARTTQTLVANTLEILRRTLKPAKATVYLRGQGGGFPLVAYDDPKQRKLSISAELADLLERGENAVRYHWDETNRPHTRHILDRLEADLLVPLYRNGSCAGVIALGAKRSGHPYDARDIAFIRAAADQIALALPNAAAQDKLDVLHKNLAELNESLRVQTNRTETLKAMNAELGEALEQLRATHLQLSQNQAAILRAERVAALSRLSVGLSQEISGPLATVLNALRAIARTGETHSRSDLDPAQQHRAIEQMIDHAHTSAAWLERTIAYIRSFQALGRGAEGDRAQRFAVRDAFTDVHQLLRLRQRRTSSTVTYHEEPEAIELYGSRQKLSLILVDLVTGAIDAYQESDIANGQVAVEAELTSEGVSIRVIDWAGGIAPAAIPRLFEQLATDDLIGNRRGLWVAKNLIEEGFGGTLDAITNDERICLTAVFPIRLAKNGPLIPPPRKAVG